MNVLHIVGELGFGGDTTAILSVMPYLKTKNIYFGYITHEGCDYNVVNRLVNGGSEVFILPGDVRTMGVIAYYIAVKKLFNSLKSRYRIVHVHTALQSCIALLAARHSGIQVRVCHSHTGDILRSTNLLQRKLFPPIMRFIINRNSTRKVACGKLAGQFLFGTKKAFEILPNGINLSVYEHITDLDIDAVKTELRLNNSSIIVGHVGRFSEEKNHEFILQLAKITRKDIIFMLVGDGKTFEYIKCKAQKFPERFIFTGRRKDIPVLMNLFDCVILPSLSEGFSIVLIEAQAAGCPCIISDNLPKDADLNMGLIQSINLHAPEEWKQNLESITKRINDSYMRKQCFAKVKSSGFEISSAYRKWIGVYLSE